MRLKTPALFVLLVIGAADPVSALDWSYAVTPAEHDPPLDYTRYVLTTTDSVGLGAWYVPAQDSAGALAPGRHPGLLVLPGDTDTMDERLGLVGAMARRGFSVLTFDHRGHGSSSDFPTDPRALVQPEFLTDSHSALDILWTRPEVDTSRVALYGESRGAVLALAVAGERSETRAVISVSSPTNWKTLLSRRHDLAPGGGDFLPAGWKRRNDPDKVIRRYNGAIFFIAGDADTRTPMWMSQDLYRAYPRSKELWVVKGAAQDDSRPEAVLGEAYYDRVAEFLHRELKKKPHRGWPYR